MKIKNIVAFACCLSAIIATSVASATSSTIPLTGGNVSPKSELRIPLTNLVDRVSYTVSCDIKDPNNENNQAVVRIWGIEFPSTIGAIHLNGEFIGNGSAQTELPKVNNLLVVTNVKNVISNAFIAVVNADQDDTIVVSNCYAFASAS